MEGDLFCGFDWSTQQLKLTVVDVNLQCVREESVGFDKDLPQYGTKGGSIAKGLEVGAPPIMWVHALDVMLGRLKRTGFPFHKVKGISGCGQQHGSVYWKKGAGEVLSTLSPDKPMVEQLCDVFAVQLSPIWQDSSTADQCSMLEGAVGGAEALADVTGSSAYERFTASQILKIVQMNHDAYSQTERISLVSSFAATLFLGSFAPIDASDASGMNLMDLRTRTWHEALLAVCAATDQDGAGGLRRRLGPVGDVLKVVGKVGNYMRERYGFREDCDITIFTGDNSASLASFCLDTSDVVVSLGTSDTLFFTVTGNPNPSTEGHVLVHPTRKDAYMVMVVYKNGSLARERIRDRYCVADWGKFGQIVEKGKHQGVKAGNVGFYFFDDEITPKCRAAVRRFENGKLVDEFPDEEINVRAVVEDRAMSMRMRAKMIGSKEGIRRRLVVTGGAALNKGILSVFAETFGADVVTSPMKGNAASLGSAYRARYGSLAKCEPRITFEQMMNSAGLGEMAVMVRWDSACADITEEDMATWAQLEEKVTSGIGDHSSL